MAIAKSKLTEDEFMYLRDDGRKYELVEGELLEAPTSLKHDAIGGNIVGMLLPYARGRGIMTLSQAGFRMKSGNIRIPDLAFTRKERLPGGVLPDTFGDGAPDLAIEIISPSEDRAEGRRKVEEYFESGAQQVWQLYPELQEAIIYASPDESRRLTVKDEIDGGDLFPGFRCTLADLFDIGL